MNAIPAPGTPDTPSCNLSLLERQRDVLELIVRGAPLEQSLAALCRVAETEAGRPVHAAILLVAPGGATLYTGAAPGLPEEYNRAVDGVPISPTLGTCAMAAALGEVVVTPCIESDPAWAPLKQLPLALGLVAAWSMPIFSSDGRVLGTFGTYFPERREPTDTERELVAVLTRTAALAIERAEADTRLREQQERKDEFIATLAHELRNPLAPIRTALTVLGLKPDEATARRCRDVMDRQLCHLVRLVDDLLDVSRITRGKVTLLRAPVDADAVLDSALEAARPVVEANGHALVVARPPRRVTVDADATRLAQVLTNLLVNAAKYTPPGGRIAVDMNATRDALRVAVRDNGVGIAPDALPRVFDMFEQGGPPTDGVQGGLGIGLTLAARLMALHGGGVEAHSDGPGKGATFVAWLPLRAPVD